MIPAGRSRGCKRRVPPTIREWPPIRTTRAAGALFNNTLQTTPDGIPDIGNANIPVTEKIDGDQFNIRIDHDVSASARLLGRLLWDDRIQDDKQTIPRSEGFNQPVDEKGRNFTLGYTHILSNTMVNEARFGYSYRKRDLLANNEGVPNITFIDGVVAFGNFSTNPAFFEQKTFHWVDTVSWNKGNHGIKFGGEVRHIRDNSDFAVRRGGYQFLNIHDFAMDEASAVTIMGINPGTGLDRAEHPQLPLLGDRILRPGRLEGPAEPHREPRAAPRMVRAPERGERSADQSGVGSGGRYLRANRQRFGGSGRSGRA